MVQNPKKEEKSDDRRKWRRNEVNKNLSENDLNVEGKNEDFKAVKQIKFFIESKILCFWIFFEKKFCPRLLNDN